MARIGRGFPATSYVLISKTLDAPATNVNAGTATPSVVANNAAVRVRSNAGTATPSVTANASVARVRPNAGTVTVSVVANNATVTAGSDANAPAGQAAVSVTVNGSSLAI